MTRIVTHAYRPRRAPRKKSGPAVTQRITTATPPGRRTRATPEPDDAARREIREWLEFAKWGRGRWWGHKE